MPITLETNAPVPNTVYLPMIMINTAIVNGKLRTSCHITLGDATTDANGEVWEAGGRRKTVYIPDVMNLETDLTDLAPQVVSIFSEIVTLAATLNGIRKVL